MHDLNVAQPAAAAETLPALIDAAVKALAAAKCAAEVMTARDMAASAYDAAARLARLKRAGEELVANARHAQAAALEIETQAQMRLAAEYAAGQTRGEIGTRGRGRSAGKLSAADVGLERYELFRAKLILDAEAREPGIVHRILAAALAQGQEPSKVLLRRALPAAAGRHRSRKAAAAASTPAAVVRCRAAVRKAIQRQCNGMSEAELLVLFGELDAELRRLKAAAIAAAAKANAAH